MSLRRCWLRLSASSSRPPPPPPPSQRISSYNSERIVDGSTQGRSNSRYEPRGGHNACGGISTSASAMHPSQLSSRIKELTRNKRATLSTKEALELFQGIMDNHTQFRAVGMFGLALTIFLRHKKLDSLPREDVVVLLESLLTKVEKRLLDAGSVSHLVTALTSKDGELLKALGDMDEKGLVDQLLDALLQEGWRQVAAERMPPIDLSAFLHALALAPPSVTSGSLPPSLPLNAILSSLASRVDGEVHPRAIANVGWALATLKWPLDPPHLEKLAEIFDEAGRSPKVNAHDLSQMSYVISRLFRPCPTSPGALDVLSHSTCLHTLYGKLSSLASSSPQVLSDQSVATASRTAAVMGLLREVPQMSKWLDEGVKSWMDWRLKEGGPWKAPDVSMLIWSYTAVNKDIPPGLTSAELLLQKVDWRGKTQPAVLCFCALVEREETVDLGGRLLEREILPRVDDLHSMEAAQLARKSPFFSIKDALKERLDREPGWIGMFSSQSLMDLSFGLDTRLTNRVLLKKVLEPFSRSLKEFMEGDHGNAFLVQQIEDLDTPPNLSPRAAFSVLETLPGISVQMEEPSEREGEKKKEPRATLSVGDIHLDSSSLPPSLSSPPPLLPLPKAQSGDWLVDRAKCAEIRVLSSFLSSSPCPPSPPQGKREVLLKVEGAAPCTSCVSAMAQFVKKANCELKVEIKL